VSERDVLIAAMVERLKQDVNISPAPDWFVGTLQLADGRIFTAAGGTREEAAEQVLNRVRGRLADAIALLYVAGVDVVEMMVTYLGSGYVVTKGDRS
jgi:hypothetical protein